MCLSPFTWFLLWLPHTVHNHGAPDQSLTQVGLITEMPCINFSLIISAYSSVIIFCILLDLPVHVFWHFPTRSFSCFINLKDSPHHRERSLLVTKLANVFFKFAPCFLILALIFIVSQHPEACSFSRGSFSRFIRVASQSGIACLSQTPPSPLSWAELCLSQIPVWRLPPCTSERDCLWRQGLYGGSQGKTRSSGP